MQQITLKLARSCKNSSQPRQCFMFLASGRKTAFWPATSKLQLIHKPRCYSNEAESANRFQAGWARVLLKEHASKYYVFLAHHDNSTVGILLLAATVFTLTLCAWFEYHMCPEDFLDLKGNDPATEPWLKYRKFFERHFSASLENLYEHRYYTVLTNGLVNNGSIFAGVTSILVYIVFGGNVMRTLGRNQVFMLYGVLQLTSSLMCINTSVLKIPMIQETKRTLNMANIEEFRERLVVLIRSRLYNPEDADRMVRKVLDMSPEEVCDAFERHTRERPSTTLGGVMGLFVFFMICNPYAKMAAPFHIPTFLFLPLIVGQEFASNYKNYNQLEIMISIVPAFTMSLIFFVMRNQHKPLKIYRHDDFMGKRNIASNLSKTMSVPKTDARQIPKLTKEQIDAMRKRNEKFHNKSKPGTQE